MSTLRSVDRLPEYEGQPEPPHEPIPPMGNAGAALDFARRLQDMEQNLRGELQNRKNPIPVIRNDLLRVVLTSTESAR
jgi:hypothetical protein